MPTPRVDRTPCGPCGRLLGYRIRKVKGSMLDPADYCLDCGRPQSERANELADRNALLLSRLTGRKPARPINQHRALPEAG